MKTYQRLLSVLLMGAGVCFWAGCEGGSDGSSHDFGDNDPFKVVCLGDSITSDINYAGVNPYPSDLAGMRSDMTILNKGRSGETSSGGAGRVGRILQGDKPGFICILYGANDMILSRSKSAAVDNLRSIVTAAKMNKTVPILATCTPMSGGRSIFDGSVKELNVLIRQMADEEGVALVDLEWEFAGSERERFPDGLHPDAAGCGIIAAAFSDRI